jgi:hypothetical protein
MSTIYDLVQNHMQIQHYLGLKVSLYIQLGCDYFLIRNESADLFAFIKITYSIRKYEGHKILLLTGKYAWYTSHLKNIDLYIKGHAPCSIVHQNDMCLDFVHRVIPNIQKVSHLHSAVPFNFYGYPCESLFVAVHADSGYTAIHMVDMTNDIPAKP